MDRPLPQIREMHSITIWTQYSKSKNSAILLDLVSGFSVHEIY